MGTNETSGGAVRYDQLDPFKVSAQRVGRATARNLAYLGMEEIAGSRGESCYLVRLPYGSILAHVEETLGTKNIVADDFYARTNDPSGYRCIALDAARMVFNDVTTSGARILTAAQHLAVGDSSWFNDPARALALLMGWHEACMTARCITAGGDTPALGGLVQAGRFVLNGSATGLITDDSRWIKGDIVEGDAIVLLGSSGIHANGLTDARNVASLLSNGYATLLPSGRAYDEALLTPTYDYGPIVQECLDHSVAIHYAVNITGHGWRKLMRAEAVFGYRIERVPPIPEELVLIGEMLGYDARKMYGTFNMGAGFALMVPQRDVPLVTLVAQNHSIPVFDAGVVVPSATKHVIIEPINVTYEEDTLAIR